MKVNETFEYVGSIVGSLTFCPIVLPLQLETTFCVKARDERLCTWLVKFLRWSVTGGGKRVVLPCVPEAFEYMLSSSEPAFVISLDDLYRG